MSARAPPKPSPPGNTTTQDDTMVERIVEGEAPDTTDTNVRYAAYANRFRTILRSAHRYVAYTSDIGESFRPVAHPNWVRAAYGVSWLYLLGDVANEGYKAYVQNQMYLRGGYGVAPAPAFLNGEAKGTAAAASNTTSKNPAHTAGHEKVALISGKVYDVNIPVPLSPKGSVPFLDDYRTVMAQRAIFQGVASMGLPAFTIHSVVKYSGRAMKDVKNVRLRTWGPIGLGLSVVPALPYMFDEPVEHATEWIFEKGYEAFTGKKGTEKAKVSAKEL